VLDRVTHARGEARFELTAVERHNSSNPAHDPRIIGPRSFASVPLEVARIARIMAA
jgi:hypothetical protein